MVFSSPIFLFAFLPLTIAIYYLSDGRIRNGFLLLASLLFYAWGEPVYVGIMIVSILVNYTCGVGLSASVRYRKPIVIVGVVINILILSVFKYTNFIIENINSVVEPMGLIPLERSSIPLPIGISFFTLQAISYIVDVYRNKVSGEKNIINAALYISLFPQLIAGPIVRYHDICAQIRDRKTSLDDFSYGCKRFILGLFKKVVIADTLGKAVDTVYSMPSDQLTTAISWWGATCFTLQIYYDFSAYSDIAIGLGRMFGFRLLENFNYPYFASSMTEGFTRWHISFSNWIRDYLFKPLGGISRSKLRTGVNLLVVFFLSGLWHGANWTFIVWAMINGTFLVLEAVGLRNLIKRLPRLLAHVYTKFIVVVSLVFFRSRDIPYAVDYLKNMFSFNAGEPLAYGSNMINNEIVLVFIMGVIFSVPLLPLIENKYRDMLFRLEKVLESRVIPASSFLLLGPRYLGVLGLASILLISGLYIANATYQPFIYFQF